MHPARHLCPLHINFTSSYGIEFVYLRNCWLAHFARGLNYYSDKDTSIFKRFKFVQFSLELDFFRPFTKSHATKIAGGEGFYVIMWVLMLAWRHMAVAKWIENTPLPPTSMAYLVAIQVAVSPTMGKLWLWLLCIILSSSGVAEGAPYLRTVNEEATTGKSTCPMEALSADNKDD